ncbi:MAG: ThuA domain-containing protein, partial [Mariniblastus sp.]|nr:ThuA domain-containing protein [Mariniblastus sp.]
DYSMECVGFITTFTRGSEWAATGKVTQGVPKDFPSPDKTSKRSDQADK